MNDLTTFLHARLNEDEETVQAFLVLPIARYSHTGPLADIWNDQDYRESGISLSPTRMLAEIDAKRRILANHNPCDDWSLGEPCEDIHLLALPYATHPDYQNEWRP